MAARSLMELEFDSGAYENGCARGAWQHQCSGCGSWADDALYPDAVASKRLVAVLLANHLISGHQWVVCLVTTIFMVAQHAAVCQVCAAAIGEYTGAMGVLARPVNGGR
jgi:hypothetical protein